MAGEFVNNGDGTHSVILTFTGATDKVGASADKAAFALWNRGLGDHGTPEDPIEYVDLTNQDKIDIIFSYTRQTLKGLVTQQVEGEHDAQAQDDAEQDLEDNYELE